MATELSELTVTPLEVIAKRLKGTSSAPGPVLLLKQHTREALIAGYDMGVIVEEVIQSGAYGENVVEKLAGMVGIGMSTLYNWASRAREIPDRGKFILLVDKPESIGVNGSPAISRIDRQIQGLGHLASPPSERIEDGRARLLRSAANLSKDVTEFQETYSKEIGDEDIDVVTAQGEIKYAVDVSNLLPAGRWRSDRYLKWVRSHECFAVGCEITEDVQAHHLKPIGMVLPVGDKLDDDWAVPLCPVHHAKFEQMPTDRWEALYGNQYDMLLTMQCRSIRALWGQSG